MDCPTVNLVNIHPTVTMPFFCPISLRRHNSATEYQKLSSNLQKEDIPFFLQLYLHVSFFVGNVQAVWHWFGHSQYTRYHCLGLVEDNDRKSWNGSDPHFCGYFFQCTLMLIPLCLVRSILKSEFVSTDPKFWVLKQNYFDHSARQDLLVLQPGLWSWWQWNPAWRAAIELTLVSSSVRQQLMKTTSDNRIHCGDV